MCYRDTYMEATKISVVLNKKKIQQNFDKDIFICCIFVDFFCCIIVWRFKVIDFNHVT